MIHNLMGIAMENRCDKAPKVQEILTKYGCIIEARIGLHDAQDKCSNEGFIILKLSDNLNEVDKLKTELLQVDGVRTDYIKI